MEAEGEPGSHMKHMLRCRIEYQYVHIVLFGPSSYECILFSSHIIRVSVSNYGGRFSIARRWEGRGPYIFLQECDGSYILKGVGKN